MQRRAGDRQTKRNRRGIDYHRKVCARVFVISLSAVACCGRDLRLSAVVDGFGLGDGPAPARCRWQKGESKRKSKLTPDWREGADDSRFTTADTRW